MSRVIEQRSSNENTVSTHFLIFVLLPVVLVAGVIALTYHFFASHPFVVIGTGVLAGMVILIVAGWKIYRVMLKHKREDDRLKFENQTLLEIAEAKKTSRTIMEENLQLLKDARTNGDNIDVEYGTDGSIKSMKVIRAQPVVSNVRVREDEMLKLLEEQKKREQIEAPHFPAPRTFSDVLQTFRPSPQGIYMMDTVNGPITTPMNKVCHVGLGGPTGGGKTNTNRLLSAQMLAAGGQMYLASPNFAPVKLNGNRLEDWRPIMAYLRQPPAQDAEDIEKLLLSFMREFENRKKAEQTSPKRGKDMYLVLGEWPGIVARVKSAPDIISLLLRESRQYGIHIISEFQDALVKTIGGDSGVRENYKTGYYFGGDKKTAKVLLDLKQGQEIDDEGLGDKGAAYLRSHSNAACPGRVPFFDNRSMYDLLGYPPDPVPDREIQDERDVPEHFAPYTMVQKTGPIIGAAQTYAGTYASRHVYAMPDLTPRSSSAMVVDADNTPTTGPLARVSVNEPTEPVEPTGTTASPSVPVWGPDDKQFTSEQEQEFLTRYQKTPNIKECLRQMNSGQGLSNRYFRHASWLVKNKTGRA